MRNSRPYRLIGRILKMYRTPPMDYLAVDLHADGRKRKARIHVLVAEAFLEPKPDWATMVCHDDGDHDNNTPSNLYWGTQLTNMADVNRHGRQFQANKTHCARGGHEFTPENTYINPTSGGRQCKECVRIAAGVKTRRGPYRPRRSSAVL
jgi:hypothetical protein